VSVRAVVAEDETVLRQQLVELLAAAWPELEVVALAADGKEAIHALELHSPDVLFLDIHMPEASGLQVARHASERSHVVFVTAYDQYAVHAFEQGAADYVMKPLSGARIAMAVSRVKERLRSRPANLDSLVHGLAAAPSPAAQYLRWINVGRGEDVHLITAEEILYFQSDTKYTREVHRSTIVNLNAISSVGRDINGHVVLRLKDRTESLLVSQPFAHLFRQM
jgi:DNA-binding LytR/AlgR family response regulator